MGNLIEIILHEWPTSHAEARPADGGLRAVAGNCCPSMGLKETCHLVRCEAVGTKMTFVHVQHGFGVS